MKCPKCNSGNTISHFGAYVCADCATWFYSDDLEENGSDWDEILKTVRNLED